MNRISTNLSMAITQRGTTIVEFAVVGFLFLSLLLGAVELGRWAFTWNLLQEGIRMGARAAAVCPVDAQAIKDIVRFNNPSNTVLNDANITVEYLNAGGDIVDDPVGGYATIATVAVTLTGYSYSLLIPGIGTVTVPPMTTKRPRESLGPVPGAVPGNSIC